MTPTKYAIRCSTEEQVFECRDKWFGAFTWLYWIGEKIMYNSWEIADVISYEEAKEKWLLGETTEQQSENILTYEQWIERGRQIGYKEWWRDRSKQQSEDIVEKIWLSKEQFELIKKRVDEFNNVRWYNEMDYGDVIYTYFYPNYILNDWDEWEANDPYRDKETNTHSCIKFINDLCKEILSFH